MKLKELYDIVAMLRSENGCTWDKAQTMQTLDSLFLEECYELSDAIRENNKTDITEELGDVSFMLFLISITGEQDGIYELDEVYTKAAQKLINRHPHVFGDVKADTEEQIIANWEQLKKQEKSERSSIFDGIPKSLPDMMRFDKLIKKLKNNNQDILEYKDKDNSLKNLLIDYAAEGKSLSSLISSINSEIENEARKKGL